MYERLKYLYSIGRTIDIGSHVKLTEAGLTLAVGKAWIDEVKKLAIMA